MLIILKAASVSTKELLKATMYIIVAKWIGFWKPLVLTFHHYTEKQLYKSFKLVEIESENTSPFSNISWDYPFQHTFAANSSFIRITVKHVYI